MTKFGCVPIALGTWFVVVFVPGILMIMCGVQPDSYGVAPLCVVVVGPIAAFITGSAFLKRCREQEAAEKRRITEERNRRAEAQRRAEEEQKQREQKRTEMAQIVGTLKGAPAQLRKSLSEAKKDLNDASRLFDERAYTLFWSAVERGLQLVQLTKKNLEYYKGRLGQYNKLAATVVPHPGEIEFNFEEYGSVDDISELFRQLAAKAHRDYEFVMVYETRKARVAELERLEEEERRRQEEEDDGD